MADGYRYLTRWLADHSNDQQVRTVGALCAVELARANEAEQLLKGLDREDPRITLLWAELHMLREEYQVARDLLEPLLGNIPAQMQGDVYRSLSRAYVDLGKPALAIELLERLPVDGNLAIQLADAYYRGGKIDRALATLEPYAQDLLKGVRDGLPSELAVETGRLLSLNARHQEAIPYLRLATELEPSKSLAWQNLATALAATGDRQAAETALQRFRELEAGVERVSLNQQVRDLEDPSGKVVRESRRLLERGQGEDALELIRNEVALVPTDLRVQRALAEVLVATNRAQEALEFAESLRTKRPGNLDVLVLLGDIHRDMDASGKAETFYRQVLEQFPQHSRALLGLARIRLARGQSDAAYEILQRILNTDSKNDEARGLIQGLQPPSHG